MVLNIYIISPFGAKAKTYCSDDIIPVSMVKSILRDTVFDKDLEEKYRCAEYPI